MASNRVIAAHIAAEMEESGALGRGRPRAEYLRLIEGVIGAYRARCSPAEVRGGVAAIAAERQRQIESEGWTPEHDDEHTGGEIAVAAACYANEAAAHDDDRDALNPPETWPWDRRWWKSTDRRRDLIKAGALIAAEIDRLDRSSVEAIHG